MPNYDYKCKKCGTVVEIFHRVSDDTKYKCDKCGSILVKKLSPGVGIIFRGSGFYETDYKRKS